MKAIFTFLIFISSMTLFSQVQEVVGDYNFTFDTTDSNLLEYNLTLNQDGTFIFHYYSNIKLGIPPEVNKYGKGKWSIEKDVISFFSENQKDEKYTLDFTNSKARFVTKSPRNKTPELVKTRLQFLKSDIFWMKNCKLFKI